jgi:hypothetical protein
VETWKVVAVVVVVAAAAVLISRWAFSSRRKTSTTSRDSMICGYSVWCFRGGKWDKIEDRSTLGHTADAIPTVPSPHEGYCVRVISRPTGAR